MTLPEKVVILSYEYDVILVSRETIHAHGTVDYENQNILLADDIKGNFLRETLLHEMMHIIDYHTAGGNDSLAERDIQRLSAVLFDTLRRNPNLMKGVRKS
jgi:hypothetical protein